MKRIVVGIDGSDESKEALRYALDEARVHRTAVLAVHAWPPPVVPPDPLRPQLSAYPSLIEEMQQAAERLLEQVVDEVARDHGNGVRIERAAIEGQPVSALLETAREDDLLVVGSRGRGGFARLVLGSVSEQVSRHAPCPVLIHRRRRA
jgi:nucleotide-binding universal stress UspA family protein